jgi:hypothetical protein
VRFWEIAEALGDRPSQLIAAAESVDDEID